LTSLDERLRLILVTEPGAPGRDLVDVVRAALRAGTPAVQLRWKGGAAAEMAELARELLIETRPAGALLFVNDRMDVALAAGADGVHLGQEDLPARSARALAAAGFLIGVSAETVALAHAAAAAGADYVGVGPVAATGSKPDAGAAVGVERVREIAAAVSIPVVAIGGIVASNAGAAVRAGAAGVAVISAVTRADDPGAAAGELLAAVHVR
jgi:thiamine-phosphate pyrophosphorylase